MNASLGPYIGAALNFSHLLPTCTHMAQMFVFFLKREADAAIELLRTKNGELESILSVLKAQPDQLNVDDVVTGTNKLYNQ